MPTTVAESAKPYLDYLDKEMTIQGILSAFCVAAGALIFDRGLAANPKGVSSLLSAMESFSYPYLFAAIAALLAAALMFYLQRSNLAWLYGVLTLAATREMQNIDTPPGSYSFRDGLEIADSWSLWNRYKCGLSFLGATVVEIALALFFAIPRDLSSYKQWIIAAAPLLLAVITDMLIGSINKRRDHQL